MTQQTVTQGVQDRVAADGRRQWNGQFQAQGHEQIVRPHVGIGNVRRDELAVQRLEELAAQHGFATAHLAHNFQESLA